VPRALYSVRGVGPPSSVWARWTSRLALIGYAGLLATSVLAEAIVWRVERDGLAFFFTADHQRGLATLLAQVAGAPPGVGGVHAEVGSAATLPRPALPRAGSPPRPRLSSSSTPGWPTCQPVG